MNVDGRETGDGADSVALKFEREFGEKPQLVAFAPGRVNLIGEHTDYNDGFVLPIAIQLGVYAAGCLTDDGVVEALSAQFPDEAASFLVGVRSTGHTWQDYLAAILAELAETGVQPRGLRLLFAGDIPLEVGLSSSAAFSVCTAILVGGLLGRVWEDKVALARLCQRAENRTGVMCGLLDQMASAACTAGSAMLLDCRHLHHETISLSPGVAILVGDTGVKRTLADSHYNERRAECERAATICGVVSLRDLTLVELAGCSSREPDTLYRRARHVISENQRVLRFADALRAGDLRQAGELMSESHRSLRDDFEVSCPELDRMVQAFMEAGALGARMVGAGFGGSTIALVNAPRADDILGQAQKVYECDGGTAGGFYTARAGDGASVRALNDTTE
jgi:galactokinase